MRLVCKLNRHRAASTEITNQGIRFTRCSKCGSDLIKRATDVRWRAVPKGYVVRWRAHGRRRMDDMPRFADHAVQPLPSFRPLETTE